MLPYVTADQVKKYLAKNAKTGSGIKLFNVNVEIDVTEEFEGYVKIEDGIIPEPEKLIEMFDANESFAVRLNAHILLHDEENDRETNTKEDLTFKYGEPGSLGRDIPMFMNQFGDNVDYIMYYPAELDPPMGPGYYLLIDSL